MEIVEVKGEVLEVSQEVVEVKEVLGVKGKFNRSRGWFLAIL